MQRTRGHAPFAFCATSKNVVIAKNSFADRPFVAGTALFESGFDFDFETRGGT